MQMHDTDDLALQLAFVRPEAYIFSSLFHTL
jgi:hypothetical protein